MNRLNRLGAYLTDLFFPPRCIVCARAGSAFCPHCAQDVEPVVGPICTHCGHPQGQPMTLCRPCQAGERDAFALIRAATLYAGPLRPAIHALKYGGQPELAVLLARYLIAIAHQPPWQAILPDIDGVIPVPLHSQRLAERGYNQSALLATAFADGTGLVLMKSWLTRTRLTQSQVGLSAIDRQKNVADAFVADRDVANKRLLLIDDVFTTGATLTACAQALRQAGAETIYGLVLSTPRPFVDAKIADV